MNTNNTPTPETDDNDTQAEPAAWELLAEAIRERDELRRWTSVNGVLELQRERDQWKEKYTQQNKDLGCEMMDPNGTIWDYAKKLQREVDRMKSLLTKRMGGVSISRHGYVEGLQRERDDARAALATTRDVLCDALPNANAPTADLARMLWSERDEARETLKSESRIACERTRLLHEEMQKKSDLSEQLTAERALVDHLTEAYDNDTQAELAAWKLLAEVRRERDELREVIRQTIMENLHLADGDDCTLKMLKDAIGFDPDSDNA